jgi:Gpi18-like mannosyltransferase
MTTTDEMAELTTDRATATTTASTTTGPGWRPAITTALTVWGAAVIGYVLINCMVWMTRNENGPKFSGMIEVWDQWDTGHYVTIALTGYNAATENPAFFPLYSMTMRVLEPVLPGGMLSAGLIISNVSCVVALVLLYRLVQDLAGSAMASRSVFYLMAYPFAFFLSAAYNEAFFLMFTVAALYFLRRSQWLLAGVMGGLASATRQAGILLVLAFAVEYLRQRNWKWREIRPDVLAIALVPVGTASYALYCWRAFGDPLKFVHVQAFWGREPTAPWMGTVRAFETIVLRAQGGAVFQPVIVLNAIDILAVVITLILLVLSLVGPWRLGRESLYLIVFSMVSFLVILISPIGVDVPLHGLPRYALEAVPAFMVLARMGANRTLERLYLMPALLTQGVLLLSFYYDIWVA